MKKIDGKERTCAHTQNGIKILFNWNSIKIISSFFFCCRWPRRCTRRSNIAWAMHSWLRRLIRLPPRTITIKINKRKYFRFTSSLMQIHTLRGERALYSTMSPFSSLTSSSTSRVHFAEILALPHLQRRVNEYCGEWGDGVCVTTEDFYTNGVVFVHRQSILLSFIWTYGADSQAEYEIKTGNWMPFCAERVYSTEPNCYNCMWDRFASGSYGSAIRPSSSTAWFRFGSWSTIQSLLLFPPPSVWRHMHIHNHTFSQTLFDVSNQFLIFFSFFCPVVSAHRTNDIISIIGLYANMLNN